ncbi:MAG: class I SAM-dependent methyltransferase [Thermoanaerobaculia bacterium]|nr:class I SAM-dependent methyltransferase [Thermoanaerobaculia bacterium]
MRQESVEQLLVQLGPDDLVLDVGGWACPFNRAQWILDAQPWETRGFYRTFGGFPFQGPEEEWFTPETWVVRDICGPERWPFDDKTFDFAICSHTLEDVRDPLFVCAELQRVAKRGYIEIPSRVWESCRGIERPGMVGLSHHRWFVDRSADGLEFLQKFSFVHTHWRFSLPRAYWRALPEEAKVTMLWWERSFPAREVTLHGVGTLEAAIEAYVRERYEYPAWRWGLFRLWKLARRVRSGVGRWLSWK